MAMSRKSWPASCSTKMIGTKTARVVRVEASIDPHTSFVPSIAASNGPFPSARWRKTFSRTTMELSMTVPTANARPASMMMLRLRPSA